MQLLSSSGWDDYQLIDSGDGYRLEKWGAYILQRPDPQVIWKKKASNGIWNKADAIFQKISSDEKGQWVKKNHSMPSAWQIRYNDLSFLIKLTPFKHTGLFPEQHTQWEMIHKLLTHAGVTRGGGLPNERSEVTRGEHGRERNSRQDPDRTSSQYNILNLFAYTGAATLVASQAGAQVTHVDASKPAIAWAKENQSLNHLNNRPIRWILDDCIKFLQREVKRGVKYDGILMDPPAFGHGPQGNVWKFNDYFPRLLDLTRHVLSPHPLFVIVNAYALSSSSLMLENVFNDYFSNLEGKVDVGELALQETSGHRLLSTGQFLTWQKK